MSIPLDDWTEENGALKIWPSSHLIMDQPPADVRNLRERGMLLPSVQTAMSMGSLFLCDVRLWHAGTPNRTDAPCPVLNLGYMRVFPHIASRYPVAEEVKRDWPKEVRKLLKTG
jgi:ectoine hydroxylase-related dioxygenase (phytanoyl-CoA dioxygenase family)